MSIVVLGADHPCGCYVLRIHLTTSVHLNYGGFKKRRRFELHAGDYTYIGSAHSRRGASSLAHRLIRHATRSANQTPHRIRQQMIHHFHAIGLGSSDQLPRNTKRLRWNVDHLLDLTEAELLGFYLLRTQRNIEASLGKFIENDEHTIVFAKGLGANDIPGNTHILRVEATADWWSELGQRLALLFHLPYDKDRSNEIGQ